jgi:integrative and conjugative element protein (TIGR02256 family)
MAGVRCVRRVPARGGGVIQYRIGASSQLLVLSDPVLGQLRRHRQLRWYQREAGGQLFARFDGNRIRVEEVTGPRPMDRRTRTSYRPDRRAEQAEIFDRHARGLHYVGDWHTHPERYPQPSSPDAQSIAECVAKSKHQLNGFVLIIVGQAEPPEGLHVSVHDGSTSFALESA